MKLEQIAAEIHAKLKCQDALTLKYIEAVLEGVLVFDGKQADYGPGNIAGFGEVGVLVRNSDKIERLKNLNKTGKKPKNESIDDTWMDSHVYGAIARMCRRGWWPGVKGVE